MTRRHSLPAEIYSLVEQTPATVLLEGGKPGQIETNEEPWTRLFTAPLRVCAAYAPEEVPALFAEIESAVAAGQCAAGFFSYECGNCFEPKAGARAARPGQPLAWAGIYAQSYVFDHKTGTFANGEPPELERFRRGRPAAEGDKDGSRVPIRGSPRSLRSAKPNTPSASPGFTSGFAPETCINSISPRR